MRLILATIHHVTKFQDAYMRGSFREVLFQDAYLTTPILSRRQIGGTTLKIQIS